jgi:hypothetical protein
LPSDVTAPLSSTTRLSPPAPQPASEAQVAGGQEVARFHWGSVFVSLDAQPDGNVLFAAGDETQRISDWLQHEVIAPWVAAASRLLRLDIEVEPGDEVVFRAPQLLATQDATISLARRFLADVSSVWLRVASASSGVTISAELPVSHALSFLGSLGTAVGVAAELSRGTR